MSSPRSWRQAHSYTINRQACNSIAESAIMNWIAWGVGGGGPPPVVKINLPRRIPHHRRPQPLQRPPRRLHVDDETAHPAARAFFRVGDRNHLRVIRVLRPGDKSLG